MTRGASTWMYGPCSHCHCRVLVRQSGLIKVHNVKLQRGGPRCLGAGTRPADCSCNEKDCWACQIDGPA